MIRFSEKAEKGIRVASMVVTVVTLAALAHIFFDALMSCLLLVWKHTVGGIVVPVLGNMESEVLTWLSFGMAVMAVYGMRKRLKEVFRGKPWRWYTVLIFPLLMVGIVIYVANWGASYGVFFRSAGNMGIYYDQIFTYTGWGVLSGLSLFAVAVSVFGMDRIYVEQKKAEQFQVQAAVYHMLGEQYSQAERLRHDLKNHVFALRGLWAGDCRIKEKRRSRKCSPLFVCGRRPSKAAFYWISKIVWMRKKSRCADWRKRKARRDMGLAF